MKGQTLAKILKSGQEISDKVFRDESNRLYLPIRLEDDKKDASPMQS